MPTEKRQARTFSEEIKGILKDLNRECFILDVPNGYIIEEDIWNDITKRLIEAINRWKGLRGTRRGMYASLPENSDEERLSFSSYLRSFLIKLGYSPAEDVPPYELVGKLMYCKDPDNPTKEEATQIQSCVKVLGYWSTHGFAQSTDAHKRTHRPESYKTLLRLVFALKLSYEEVEDLFNSIGARQLYSLDCHDHAVILAIRYNECARANGSTEITYDEAIVIANDAGAYFTKCIEEIISGKEGIALRDTLRELYMDAKELAGSDGSMTLFTEMVSDRIQDITAKSISESSYEDIVKSSIAKNIGPMLRARRTLMAVMVKYLIGSTDITEPAPKACIWLTEEYVEKAEDEHWDINKYAAVFDSKHDDHTRAGWYIIMYTKEKFDGMLQWFLPFNRYKPRKGSNEVADFIRDILGVDALAADSIYDSGTREDQARRVITERPSPKGEGFT